LTPLANLPPAVGLSRQPGVQPGCLFERNRLAAQAAAKVVIGRGGSKEGGPEIGRTAAQLPRAIGDSASDQVWQRYDLTPEMPGE
jgi:hypothetical protein